MPGHFLFGKLTRGWNQNKHPVEADMRGIQPSWGQYIRIKVPFFVVSTKPDQISMWELTQKRIKRKKRHIPV